ncbi:hypothetical protein RHMOL_Rhmol06G0258200 [Rhododendron molle]|uniref:Uncharacterized protein n=1 Tax=Rhododendron molle TaxID=49168 RepID=A0ACC0NH43_RHOML|nr:hypothetical protein RHMOL_Rhmol06G0258200 [Rhododendron molle]
MQLAGWTESYFADSFLLRNLDQELSKLAFSRLTKIDCKDTHPAHGLAKRAILSSTTSTAAQGIPFWIGATINLHILFL